jgi:hypothetical protein
MLKRTMSSFYGITLKNHNTYLRLASDVTEVPLDEIFSFLSHENYTFEADISGYPGIFDFEITSGKLVIYKGLEKGNSNIIINAGIPGRNIGIRTVITIINNDALYTDDFEYDSLSESDLPWYAGGSTGWEISSSSGFSGTGSIRSGIIDHSQSSEISIATNLTEDGTLTFSYKTSTYYSYYLDEIDGDFLNFFVDGINISKKEDPELWGGINDWRTVSYKLKAGTRTLKWQYHKNDWGTYYEDAVWIDYSVIPGTPVKNTINAPQATKKILLEAHPNPFNPATTISFVLENSEKISLKIFDAAGRLSKAVISGELNAGLHRFEIDGSRLSTGMYYAVLETQDQISAKKIILIK